MRVEVGPDVCACSTAWGRAGEAIDCDWRASALARF
jgi:hypothetical protein